MKRLVWVALSLLLAACNTLGERQKARWNQQNILDYRYTLRVVCFCPPPAGQKLRIEVGNGQTISVKDAQTGESVDPAFLERYTTINKLFQIITEAEAKGAAKLEVQYNPDLGFPTNTFIDYIARAADDEIGFSVEEFEVKR